MSTIIAGGYVLHEVADELWASAFSPGFARVVVRRHNGLYQADYGDGSSAWHATPEGAVDAAMREDGDTERRVKQRVLISEIGKAAA